MIPREVIDEIRNRVDIIRLIGESVPLKKIGRNHSARCPFHQEKSPSFTVSESKQLYHCFGCGEGGTAITFLMKFHHLTFPEAIERLAVRAGIDLAKYSRTPEQLVAKKQEQQNLLKILSYARDIYHRAFLESEGAAAAREYAKKRGIAIEAAKKYGLGYAPASGQALVQAIARDHRSLDDATKVGLIAKRSSGMGHYDIFRDRLLFPIENAKGEMIGFGGRSLGDGTPKYLNSPQTVLFDKSRTLYGLAGAADAIRATKRVVVVEGYMDQISLREAGLLHVVATLGTALTEGHARLLGQVAEETVLLFDGDDAGIKAARRSLLPLLSHGLRVRVALLPRGYDPDKFVIEKGKSALEELLEGAVPLLDFFVQRFFRDEHDVGRKATAVEELAALVKGAQTPFLQEALLEEVARGSGLDREVLRGKRWERPVEPSKVRTERPSVEPAPLPTHKEEWILIRLAAEFDLARERLMEEETLGLLSRVELMDEARDWFAALEAGQSNGPSAWVDAWPNEATRSQLAAAFLEVPVDEAGQSERIFRDCVRKLQQRHVSAIRARIEDAERSGDEEAVTVLQRQLQKLKVQSVASVDGRIAG